MGQIVSYLYGCCESEKEECSYDHPNLLTGALVPPPSLVSCIGSSADGAVHQFMVHDSGILDVEDKTIWYSCSDEALQQDQLNSPPTAIPSTNSGTIETLLQELLIAPPTVIPSIGPSTHETLQPDEIIAPPTLVPNIDPSSNEALQQDVLTFPPTLVPSINSSTNKALQHDLIITPSTVVLSVDSRSNDGLHHDQVIAPSTVVPSINSGIDEAFDQFNGIDSGIQDVEDRRKVYPPRWNSCSDSSTNEALQQDQLYCPTGIPSIDSRTVEALLQDLLIAPTTVVASISTSSNEALQQDQIIAPPAIVAKVLQEDQIIAPPAIVASIESSTNEELQQDMLNFPSTVVPSIESSTNEELQRDVLSFSTTVSPSIDSSTNEALQNHLIIAPSPVVLSIDSSINDALQHDLLIAPSNVVRNIDTSTNDALQHDLIIAPSTVVRSISSSIDEAFHQFNEIDSAIEVLVDKRRVDKVNDDLEEKESRKVKKKQHEDKLRIKVVQLERKIKHYSSSQKILLVGEGDFSFSACLAMFFGSASNMVATSLDSKAFLKKNYKNAKSNICELRSRGCKVMHSVDATEMAYNSLLNYLIFDRIIYNFPLVGFFPGTSRRSQLKWNRKLVLQFLDNAKELISENGEIHITHKSFCFFLEWNLQHLASQVGLRLVEEVPFNLKDYKGYNTKYGFGGDDNFDCNPSKTYKFGLKLRKTVKGVPSTSQS